MARSDQNMIRLLIHSYGVIANSDVSPIREENSSTQEISWSDDLTILRILHPVPKGVELAS